MQQIQYTKKKLIDNVDKPKHWIYFKTRLIRSNRHKHSEGRTNIHSSRVSSQRKTPYLSPQRTINVKISPELQTSRF